MVSYIVCAICSQLWYKGNYFNVDNFVLQPDNRALLIPGFIGAAAGMLFLGPSELTGLQDYKYV